MVFTRTSNLFQAQACISKVSLTVNSLLWWKDSECPMGLLSISLRTVTLMLLFYELLYWPCWRRSIWVLVFLRFLIFFFKFVHLFWETWGLHVSVTHCKPNSTLTHEEGAGRASTSSILFTLLFLKPLRSFQCGLWERQLMLNERGYSFCFPYDILISIEPYNLKWVTAIVIFGEISMKSFLNVWAGDEHIKFWYTFLKYLEIQTSQMFQSVVYEEQWKRSRNNLWQSALIHIGFILCLS